MKTVTLFRPVGNIEYKLIKKSGRFPPRLPEQPIFYPVCNEDYAISIARDWNTKDKANGNVGIVLKFEVNKDFLDKYEVHIVGAKKHEEYWIPAEDLESFNDNIVGEIKLIHKFELWHIYMVRCNDGTIYTGVTNDLEARLEAHNSGKGAKYTQGRGPVALIRSFTRLTKGEALSLEYKIKQLSRDEKLAFKDE